METGNGAKMISYREGDATEPGAEGKKIIVHICNDSGKWGKGFVLAISRRWKAPEKAYRLAFAADAKPALGDVQFVSVDGDITVANLIGQAGVQSTRGKDARPPIRYDAVRRGLRTVAAQAMRTNASVHMPRIGCGLAGGRWEEIEPIMAEELAGRGIHTVVYDFRAARAA